MYQTKILRDSVAPCGRRLTTWEPTYPRFVHAELMTHRMFSRNSASSRAIPTERLMTRIREDPALPVWWGRNQSGMQADQELSSEARATAQLLWLKARDQMLEMAERLSVVGLHKQIVNRIIEPWMFITVIVSATEFANWFHLRTHRAAQPEIAWVARSMWTQYSEAAPTPVSAGDWHLPLLGEQDLDTLTPENQRKVSTGRCARVSYLTHEGVRDVVKDIELHDKLCAGPATGEPGHWSPFEHVAMALDEPQRCGNFVGWRQYRKWFSDEHYGEVMP